MRATAKRSSRLPEYSPLCIALHVGVRDADEVAEYEIVVGAEAGRRAYNVPRGRFKVKAGKAISLVPDFRVPTHPPMPARQKLRIGEQARQASLRLPSYLHARRSRNFRSAVLAQKFTPRTGGERRRPYPPHAGMPMFVLTSEQRQDIIAYILSLKTSR